MNVQEIIAELQSLDAQNPGAWPIWARIGAAVLLGIAIVIGGIYMLVKPLHEQLGQEQAKELDLRTQFENNQRKAAALDAFKEQLAEMERNFGAMLRQLPSRSEVANLLNDISQTRIASSLEEELFQPESESPKEFYAELPNKIIVSGTYHEMGSFVSSIAALPRIVTIEDVDIRPLASGNRNAKESLSTDQLRMQATAKTYRYLDDEEISAEEAKNAPAKKGGQK